MPKSLPLVQLQLLAPLLKGLRLRGVDPDPVLESVGLTQSAVDHEGASVHVMVMHQFVENCAAATGDKTFCATIGAQLDPTGWPMVRAAFQQATTLGDFLNVYVAQANKYASSSTPYVDVRGEMATFGETRRFAPLIEPAQNDGFMIGLKMAMLRRVLVDVKEPERVILVLCDPSVLPKSFSRYQSLRGDQMGPRIQFPSKWLTLTVANQNVENGLNEIGQEVQMDDFLAGFRGLLSRTVGNGGVKANEAAELLHMNQRTLARHLSRLGTSISKEVSLAKMNYAKEELESSHRSIDDIAAALGYSDPSNFSRAFAKEEGQRPYEYRKSRNQSSAS
ncbi:MAG: helix-turn-helix domain-containing protein [Marinosulfonomonas sp.]